MYLLYNLTLILYWLMKLPVVIKRMLTEEGYARRLFESGGVMPEERRARIAGRHAIWIHAASVGEIVAASAVAKEVRRTFPEAHILVSVVTATGHEMARHIIHEAEDIIFFPLDLPFSTRRILDLVDPSIIVILETEIWPNFIRYAHQKGIPMLIVNGRISDRSIRGYRRVRFFMNAILKHISYFCMQSQVDATYIKELGAAPERVIVTGNTKYDSEHTKIAPADITALRRWYGTEGTFPVVVAGSTHPGEESMVLEAFREVVAEQPHARLLIAPRNIHRGEEVRDLFRRKGFEAICRTEVEEDAGTNAQVVVVDTIGELGRLYAISDIVFVGGSLVPVGGHNILEAAIFGKPIIVGPHMFNFKDIYGLLQRNHGIATVENDKELARTMRRLAADPVCREALGQRCMQVMQENQGASRKNVAEIRRLLTDTGRLPYVEPVSRSHAEECHTLAACDGTLRPTHSPCQSVATDEKAEVAQTTAPTSSRRGVS